MSDAKPRGVLIVDDDQQILNLLSLAFTSAGFLPFAATSGQAGVKLAEAVKPMLIVTDIIMDNGDGIETIMAYRKINPLVKIVAISGGGSVGSQDFLELAKQVGAHSAIGKPFRPSAIVQEALRLLDDEGEKRVA